MGLHYLIGYGLLVHIIGFGVLKLCRIRKNKIAFWLIISWIIYVLFFLCERFERVPEYEAYLLPTWRENIMWIVFIGLIEPIHHILLLFAIILLIRKRYKNRKAMKTHPKF